MSPAPDRMKVPHYRITSVYEDGASAEPELYSVIDLHGDWGASRKEFLQVGAALGLVGCCVIGAIADAFEDDESTPPGTEPQVEEPAQPVTEYAVPEAVAPDQPSGDETVAPEPADQSEPPDGDDGGGTGYGVGGYTYCTCDQICTCIPIV